MQYCKNRLNMNVANISDKQTKDDLNTGETLLEMIPINTQHYNKAITYETIEYIDQSLKYPTLTKHLNKLISIEQASKRID